MREAALERQCHPALEDNWLAAVHIWWNVVDNQFELADSLFEPGDIRFGQEDMQQEVVDPDSWGRKVEHWVQEEALDRYKTFSKGSLRWRKVLKVKATYHC